MSARPARRCIARGGLVINGYAAVKFRGAKRDCVPCSHASALLAHPRDDRGASGGVLPGAGRNRRPESHTDRMKRRIDTPEGGRAMASASPPSSRSSATCATTRGSIASRCAGERRSTGNGSSSAWSTTSRNSPITATRSSGKSAADDLCLNCGLCQSQCARSAATILEQPNSHACASSRIVGFASSQATAKTGFSTTSTSKVTGDRGSAEGPPAGVRVDRRVRLHGNHRVLVRRSAMRVCQPGPVAFHRSMTSSGSRIEMSLRGLADRGRPPLFTTARDKAFSVSSGSSLYS